MRENFLLEKQMSSFMPSNILIIKYRIFSSSFAEKIFYSNEETNKYAVLQCSRGTVAEL